MSRNQFFVGPTNSFSTIRPVHIVLFLVLFPVLFPVLFLLAAGQANAAEKIRIAVEPSELNQSWHGHGIPDATSRNFELLFSDALAKKLGSQQEFSVLSVADASRLATKYGTTFGGKDDLLLDKGDVDVSVTFSIIRLGNKYIRSGIGSVNVVQPELNISMHISYFDSLQNRQCAKTFRDVRSVSATSFETKNFNADGEALSIFENELPAFANDIAAKAAGLLAVQISSLPVRTTAIEHGAPQKTSNVEDVRDSRLKPAAVSTINKPIADKWALVIGISKFQNPQYNLKYAAKDAQDFYNYLIGDGHFKKDHVLLLLNENATRRNVMAAFGDKFLPAVTRDGDLVAIYVATHGTPANKDPGKRNFIVAYDTEADALYETGVDMDELYRRVKEGVRTDRALIVMDTCYSGAGIPGARGMDACANFDAAQVAQGFGHLVLSSSSPSERSWESKVSTNGVFTKYLLQNLRLANGNVKNAYKKLKDDVGWEVQNAFNQPQHPQLGGDWEGEELVLSATPNAPRAILNPDLLKLINLQSSPTQPRSSGTYQPRSTKLQR